MSTGNVKALPITGVASATVSEQEKNIQARIKSRLTKEIVIGVCGAVGCNLADVVDELKNQFGLCNYEVIHIKLSNIIKTYYSTHDLPAQHFGKDLTNLGVDERYRVLQDLGNSLRKALGDEALATLAIHELSLARQLQINESGDEDPPRTVYVIDQLKNPAEVDLFRLVYKNIFYLVGVMSPQQLRLEQLRQEGMSPVAAQELIERDRNENIRHGQLLEKTVQKSDFFIRNALTTVGSLAKPCSRFVGLVHGQNGLTPTSDESGMYAAHSASLKSACLSRQVGAAIADETGNILSVGWNDVPQAGGGLYTADNPNDQRCVTHGRKCYNDFHKLRLVNSIVKILRDSGKVNQELAAELSEKILKDTPAGSLIEYSRAIHAEMEAILNIARKPAGTTLNGVMYTTTYPCHNCARHIIASGLKRVVYIEPYEKSLAMDLHSDAISIDLAAEHKIIFETFEGVSPKRYAAFFAFNVKRKDDRGQAVSVMNKEASPVSQEILDSYLDVEAKVFDLARGHFTPPPA
jgi:deoxycytidylate deaminase